MFGWTKERKGVTADRKTHTSLVGNCDFTLTTKHSHGNLSKLQDNSTTKHPFMNVAKSPRTHYLRSFPQNSFLHSILVLASNHVWHEIK